jgi:hypothetical protein
VIAARCPVETTDPGRIGMIGDFLEPHEGRKRVTRAIPCLKNGSYRVLAFRPDRFDVTDSGVALQASLRLRLLASGREETRAVHIGAGSASFAAPGDGYLLVGDRRERWSDLVGEDPESGAFVRLSPADPALPQLRDVLSSGYLDALPVAAGARGHGRPRLEILAHRFGKRITLRWRLSPASAGSAGGRDLLLKIYSEKGDAELARALGILGGREADGTTFPRLIHRDEGRRLAVVTWVPGTSAHRAWDRGPSSISSSLGRSVRRYQTSSTADLPRYGAAEEIRTIRKFAGRVSVLRPDFGAALTAQACAWRAEVEARREERRVLAHRDLHDKQVLSGPEGIGVIDWDLAALAPAGLDPGNYLAHLLLRSLQGRLSTRQMVAERRAFLHGFGANGTGRLRSEIRFWEHLTLLRLAGVYALRPGRSGLPEGLLIRAAREGGRT